MFHFSERYIRFYIILTFVTNSVIIYTSRKELLMNEFTNKYAMTKTLCFGLLPQGKTLQHFNEGGYLARDEKRVEHSVTMKEIMDRFYRQFITTSLSTLSQSGFDVSKYAELYTGLKNIKGRGKDRDKLNKDFESEKQKLRKQIADIFASTDDFNYIKKDHLKFVKDIVPTLTKNDTEAEIANSFLGFIGYFDKYFSHRSAIFTSEKKVGSIAYRIVDDNLPIFLDNIQAFQNIKKLNFIDIDEKLEHSFSLDAYKDVLTQNGIDCYNVIISGYSEEDGHYEKGLNQLIAEYNQKENKSLPLLKKLKKMILTPSKTFSFVNVKFENEEELYDSLDECIETLSDILFDKEQSVLNVIGKLRFFNLDNVYINQKALAIVSQHLLGDWEFADEARREWYDTNYSDQKKTKTYINKREQYLKSETYFSISDIETIFCAFSNEPIPVVEYYEKEAEKCTSAIKKAISTYKEMRLNKPQKKLQKDDERIQIIKTMLDAIKKAEYLLKNFIIKDEINILDETFYAAIDETSSYMITFNKLYNMTYAFITTKPYSKSKIEMHFDTSNFLDGWTKEDVGLGSFLIKDNDYFLAIINKDNKKVLMNAPVAISDNTYQKIEYSQTPQAIKNLPRIYFPKKESEEFQPSANILSIKEKQSYKTSLSDLHLLIDYYKECFEKRPSYKVALPYLKETSEYQSFNEFCNDVETFGYQLSKRPIDASYIDKLVDDGCIYLFKLISRDFKKTKDRKHLNALYFESLFSDENLKSRTYKLLGGAQMFFRKASLSIKDTTVHPANVPMINKQNTETTRTLPYEVIKDRRFTKDQFSLNVTIGINTSKMRGENINPEVEQYIRENSDSMHIIGLKRGERNLVYAVVIDTKGNIVEQKNFNVIESYENGSEKLHLTDYNSLLEKREAERRQSKQNWKTIETIKGLKDGFMGQVVSEIAKMMIKYNAIVVLESLSSDYKQDKMKVEKNVYSSFEAALIKKLNFYVCNKCNDTAPGGLLNAYQLTNKFISLDRIGLHSGFLFFVSPYNTSNLDPTTGYSGTAFGKYINLFKAKEFINEINDIRYNNQEDYFEFDVVSTCGNLTKNWTVCSHGVRADYSFDPTVEREALHWVKPTDLLKELFTDYKIDYHKKSIKSDILEINSADFYRKFLKLYNLIVKLKNNGPNNVSETISPVRNASNSFFITGKNFYPECADANGAYNLARKGLIQLMKIVEMEDGDKLTGLTNEDWMQYVTENTLT